MKPKKLKLSEDEILKVINNIANRLARKFRFGYHDIEDMKQEARLIAWEGLSAWDQVRPLENFLWTHTRNRLHNLKRDKYERPRPCLSCGNTAHCYNQQTCETYQNWDTINKTKKNLMTPIDIGGVDDEHEKNMRSFSYDEDKIDYEQLLNLINRELPINMRALFIKLQYGNKLNKVDRTKIQECVQEILERNGYDSKT
jgi:DNA-directed RNA polymerase specialized sigma24 family protein